MKTIGYLSVEKEWLLNDLYVESMMYVVVPDITSKWHNYFYVEVHDILVPDLQPKFISYLLLAIRRET